MIDIVILNVFKNLEKTLFSIYMQNINNLVKVYVVGNKNVKIIPIEFFQYLL